MSLAFDETGRPFIILREQAKKKRVKGLEAHKVSWSSHCSDGAAPPSEEMSSNWVSI